MLDRLYDKIGADSYVPVVIISVAIMLISGFLVTRVTKIFRLPNVTAYILAGIVVGPYCLNMIPSAVVDGMEFISDVALAFIAFSAGEFFRISALKKNGKKLVVITLFEALTASLLIFILTFFILGLSFAFSIILSALASATAPASTLMTIRQTGAKGDFVDTLLSAVALDDVVSLVAFSVAVSVAVASMGGGFSASDVLLPAVWNVLMVAVGCGFGFLLKILMAKRSTDNRLIVSVAFLFAVCGIGAALDVSPLLACMAMGTVYINVSDDDKLFKQLNYFSPPVLLLFFVRSGAGFRLDSLTNTVGSTMGVPLLVVGVLYFAVRIAGKYVGAFVGCAAAGKPKKVRSYLGLALIPQAGVAIGLSALGARLLGGETGGILQTVILSSSILYELVGPACAKAALYFSGSYGKEERAENGAEPENREKNEVETLKKRLYAIQAEIERKEYSRSEEELVFTEAADEGGYYEAFGCAGRNRRFKNRR